MKLIFFLLLVVSYFILPRPFAFGDEDHGDHSHELKAEHLKKVIPISINSGKGQAFIIVRNDGHMLGLPYIIELRVNCNSKSKDWSQATPVDSTSACGVSEKQPELDTEHQNIDIEIFEPNTKKYNMTEAVGTLTNIPDCQSRPMTRKLSFKRHCEK